MDDDLTPIPDTCFPCPVLDANVTFLYGGGGPVPRTYGADDIRKYIGNELDDKVRHSSRYELVKYVHIESLDAVLESSPHAFPVHMPITILASRFNSRELATLARLHSIHIPRHTPKDLVLDLFVNHHCDVCEHYVPLFSSTSVSVDLLNQTFRPEYIEKVAHKVKAFSMDEVAAFTEVPDYLKEHYAGGARFVSLRVVESNVEPEPSTFSQLLCMPVPWLHIARKSPKDVVLQLAQIHGISVPKRTSKDAAVEELRAHSCRFCRTFCAVFEPVVVAKRVRKQKVPKARPSTYSRHAPSEASTLSDTSDTFLGDSIPLDLDQPERVGFPPPALSDRETLDITRDFCDGLKPIHFEEAGCAVCGQLKLLTDLSPLTEFDGNLDMLKEPHMARLERTDASDRIRFDDGPVLDHRCSGVCSKCAQSLRKGRRPVQALANGLWVGEVPDVLSSLTWIEQLLVARVRTNRYVIRLSVVTERGYVPGHIKMSSNAVAFAAPTPKVYSLLPPRRDELDDVLAIFFTGVKPIHSEDIAERTPYLCRRKSIAAALEWLKLNHSDYADLQIDHSALATYPERGIPVDVVWRKPQEDTSIIAAATSVHDRHEEPGTDEGQCTFTLNGLVGSQLDRLSIDARKAYAVQHLHSGGHVLAVGHSDAPESIFNNHQLYPQIFPWLFPYGLGGVANPRTRGLISQTRHKKYLMMFHDKRFQVEGRFLIIAFNHEQIADGTRSSFVLAKRSNFDRITSTLSRINPAVVRSIANRLEAGERVRPETDEERMCFSVMDQIEHVGEKVSGSLAGKKNMRNELWSLIAFEGAPSWFLTLSPLDDKHPICLYWADHNIKFTPHIRNFNERARLIAKNPVAGARFFHFMVQLFVKCMLRWADPDGRSGLFGRTSAFYGTVEQQGRMTLHLHMLIWIFGAFSPQKVRDLLMSEDSEFQRGLIEYLESCQVGEFLTGTFEEVDKRFHPQRTDDPTQRIPVSPPVMDCDDYETCACGECNALREWRRSFRDTVDKIIWKCNVHECFDQKGLKKSSGKYKIHATAKGCINKDGICTARFPREIFHRTTVDKEGRVYLMKKEKYINSVTPVVVYGFGCNTDSTSLGSGTAVKATVGYIADYVVKMSLKTYQIFSSIYDVFERQTGLVDSVRSGDSEAGRKLILKLANNLTSKIEIGGPMAAMYLLQNPDHYTSHSFVPLYWKTYVLDVLRSWEVADTSIRTDGQGHELATQTSFDSVDAPEQEVEDSGAQSIEEDNVLISRAGGYFVSRSSVDDYKFRPDEMDGVCLYEWVQCNSRKLIKTLTNKSSTPHYRYRPEHGLYHSHVVAFDPRRKFRVVPTLISSFLPRSDCDDRDFYCTTMLTLFAPWRTGLDLRSQNQTWADAFDSFVFESRYSSIIENLNIRYECYDARDDYQSQLNLRTQEDEEGNLGDMDEQDGLGDMMDEGADASYNELPSGTDLGDANLRWLHQMNDIEQVMQSAGWVVDGSSAAKPMPDTFKPERLLPPSKWRIVLSNARKREIAGSNSKRDERECERMDVDRDFHVVNDARVVSGSFLLGSFGVDDPVVKAQMSSVSDKWTLNCEQLRAYNIVAQHAVSVHPEPLRMYIGGPGGTGKSRIIKALLNFFNDRGDHKRLVVLAPTGAAASVVGGSTYHSFLGIQTGSRRKKSEEEGGASLDTVRDKLRGVDYIFIDEVSMISCQELHLIDARLKLISGADDLPFGGFNVILAGDFAQLPPAGAGEPLYSGRVSKVQLPRQVQKDQEETLGLLVWHQFLVVVTLTEIMRQTGEDPEDDKFRTMLNNLRYKDCTVADIAWLRSRIPAFNPEISLNDERFRDVAVITAWNSHKDRINAMSATRFAHERKLKLYHFYSIDKESRDSNPKRRRLKTAKSTASIRLTQDIQESLWSMEPHTSDHIPAHLPMCLGMPIMVRYNEATELCVTKGQEGVVKGWTSREIPGYPGRFALETLFVELTTPAKTVKLSYLPENIVPLTRRSHSVKAILPNDQSISVSRNQVPILLNFSMTDYTSQGKTRPVNIVDLNYSRNHQAAYTALSRGTCAKDTIILRDFNVGKLCGGLSGHLRQEFRELDILSEITELVYSGQLPVSIMGRLRESTIASYREWKKAKDATLGGATGRAGAMSGKRKADGLADIRASKRLRSSGTVTPRMQVPLMVGWMKSWSWDSQNWSCAYDSLLTILRFVWFGSIDFWGEELTSWGPLSAELNSSFHQLEAGSIALSEVRSRIRSVLHNVDPMSYPMGRRGTDIHSLARSILGVSPATSVSTRFCVHCGRFEDGLAYEDIGRYTIMRRSPNESSSVSGYLRALEDGVGCCSVCGGRLKVVGDDYPTIMCVQVPAYTLDQSQTNLSIDPVVHLTDVTYALRGVVYYSDSRRHFTSRIVDHQGMVFTYDGMLSKGSVVPEEPLSISTPSRWLSTSNCAVASQLVYIRVPHVA